MKTTKKAGGFIAASVATAVTALSIAGSANEPAADHTGATGSTVARADKPKAASLDVLVESDGDCTMAGGSKKAKTISAKDTAADLLKNRYDAPATKDFDSSITLADFLSTDATAKSTKLDPKKAATITGYIVDVEKGGAELCNCQTKDTTFYDTHIYIGPTADTTDLKECMIAEITPRMRKALRPNSNEWDTDQITHNYRRGTKVQLSGWLFYDEEHHQNAVVEPRTPGSKARIWRKSCWEIHPVTDIQRLGEPTNPGAPDEEAST